MVKGFPKSCLNCGRLFKERKHEQKFCSQKCQRHQAYLRFKKDPVFVLMTRNYAKSQYDKIKNNPEYKLKKSIYYKEWCKKKKEEKQEQKNKEEEEQIKKNERLSLSENEKMQEM